MSQTEENNVTFSTGIKKNADCADDLPYVYCPDRVTWMKLERMMTGGEGTGSEPVSVSPASRVVVILTDRCERPYPRSQLQASPARRC